MFDHKALQLFSALHSAKKVIIIPHQSPDGDALGSTTALAGYLTHQDKPFVLFCATPFEAQYEFLPYIDTLTNDPDIFNTVDEDTLIVVCDSGDLCYAGVADYVDPTTMKVANVDHHITNEGYGAINLVSIKSSSTCEIIYRFFKTNDVDITRDMATSLLTGIITDTDNFTNSATSDRAIKASSDLVRKGANFNLIKQNVYKSTPLAAFKLWGEMLSRLTHHEPLDLVYTYLTHADTLKHNVSEADMKGMSNFMNAVSDGVAGMILKEREDGTVKGSFRTTRDDVDVSAMAQHFGGGGHQKAAGFSVDGPMETALKHILQELEAHFGPTLVVQTVQAS